MQHGRDGVLPGPAIGIAGMRLLVAEDEFILAQHLAEVVEGFGVRVVGPVPSVDDALDLVAQGAAIDAAMLDISLRGQSVYPLADALLGRRVPIVFTSGYGRECIPQRFDAVPLLMKPVAIPTMVAALLDIRRRVAAAVH